MKVRPVIVCSILLLGPGCATKIPVTTMDRAIAGAIESARAGGQGSVTSIKVELSVTTGYKGKAGATAPIPVVPITLGAEATRANVTRITFTIDPRKYDPPDSLRVEGDFNYLLDTRTGRLEPVPAE